MTRFSIRVRPNKITSSFLFYYEVIHQFEVASISPKIIKFQIIVPFIIFSVLLLIPIRNINIVIELDYNFFSFHQK